MKRIIDGRQKKNIRAIEIGVTSVGWLVMIWLLFQIIFSILVWTLQITSIFNQLIILGDIEDSIKILLTTVLISMLAFLVMYGWGQYNARKFGKLKRRTFPTNVTEEELSEYFHLPIEKVREMQAEKYILLEENVLHDK